MNLVLLVCVSVFRLWNYNDREDYDSMEYIQTYFKLSYGWIIEGLIHNTLLEYHTHERVLFGIFHSWKTFRFSTLLHIFPHIRISVCDILAFIEWIRNIKLELSKSINRWWQKKNETFRNSSFGPRDTDWMEVKGRKIIKWLLRRTKKGTARIASISVAHEWKKTTIAKANTKKLEKKWKKMFYPGEYLHFLCYIWY